METQSYQTNESQQNEMKRNEITSFSSHNTSHS